MEIRSFADIITPDERTLRCTPMGLSLAGMLTPEDSTEFEQLAIADADLVDAVPDNIRSSYERLRACHSYGVLWYEAFTVAADLAWVVLEQALRERFIEFYECDLLMVDVEDNEHTITVRNFGDVEQVARKLRREPGGGRLKLRSGRRPISLPLTLDPLLRWARAEGLLVGQRNKRMDAIRGRMRNHFAHGASFRIGTPNDSARRIRDLAEIINRLWGASTPGGRLYPAPLSREVRVVGWARGDLGPELTVLRPDQLATHNDYRGRTWTWTYLVVLAAPAEEELWSFDSRYELTVYPCDLLWGPGNGEAAIKWCASTTPPVDTVTYLDRLFAIRVHQGKVYLPRRPSVVLGLPPEQRRGRWHLVRADSPFDALTHVRHLPPSCRAANDPFSECPIDLVSSGTWGIVRSAIQNELPGVEAEHPSASGHAPRLIAYAENIGYE